MTFHTFHTDIPIDVIDAGPTDDETIWDVDLFKVTFAESAPVPEVGDGFQLINEDGVWIGKVADVLPVSRVALLDIS